MTRVVMTLLVRDEADIVGPMIDAHLALGVDFVVATDNRSVDGTTRVLESYERRGVLRLIHEPADDYRQGAWVTRMARIAAVEHGADWVVNADADEFWWPESGDLRTTLAAVPAECATVAVERRNFVVRPEDGRPFHRRMVWRRTDGLTHDGATMGPKVCHRADPDAVVAPGNHAVSGLVGGQLRDGGLQVLHFPLRTYERYAAKIELGTAALERNPDFGPEVGFHWRRSATLQRSGDLSDAWRSWVFDDDRLAAAIADGEVVEDRRVADLVDRTAGAGGRRSPVRRLASRVRRRVAALTTEPRHTGATEPA
jgi:hypothetical protein